MNPDLHSTPDCFSYDLPEDRIAQRPVHPYDAAKMLVIERSSGRMQDRTFREFPPIVKAGDLVVFNNSKVIPARLFGQLEGKGAEIELLLLRETGKDRWLAMGRPLRKLTAGSRVVIGEKLRAVVIGRCGEMEIEVQLESLEIGTSPRALLALLGSMPVPPYIRGGRGDSEDAVDYQPIFAKLDGSVAAPTASLHFTSEVVAGIRSQGADVLEVTLHVGAASFLPLWREGQGGMTPPGRERFAPSSSVAEQVRAAKRRGGRVIAVGTTVVRALESMMRSEIAADGVLEETDLFITPGFQWQAVDVLVTNFHQPRTTHLLLVEALMGKQLLASAYSHALEHGYRFLSYGDGMVILP